jgi:hypothetical protein
LTLIKKIRCVNDGSACLKIRDKQQLAAIQGVDSFFHALACVKPTSTGMPLIPKPIKHLKKVVMPFSLSA